MALRASRSAGCSAIRRCACSTITSPSSRSRSQHARVPRFPQRGMAHRRHLRHLQHSAARTCSASATDRPLPTSISSASARWRSFPLATWWLIRSPWGRAFMALRENPAARAVARRRHAPLHADGVCDRLGARRRRRRRSMRRWCNSSIPCRSTLSLSLDLLLMVIVGGSGYLLRARSSARSSPCCCPNGCASPKAITSCGYAVAVMLLLMVVLPVRACSASPSAC